MSIKNLHRNRQQIATFALAVFSIVFICDFLCDFGIINNSYAYQDNVSHNHNVVTKGHHDGHNEHGLDTVLVGNESDDHDQAHDEDCCDEETSQFYANLIKYNTPNFDLTKVLVLDILAFVDLSDANFIYKETNPHRLKSALSPPAAGMNARILFQSFRC